MTFRLEIVPAEQGRSATVETYVKGRRTGISEPLPLDAARAWGERAASGGTDVVDHTQDRPEDGRERAIARFRSGGFRP